MKFKFDETVRIKRTGITGTICDISTAGGVVTYAVDTDSGDEESLAPAPVFYCKEDEIEKV